LWRVKNPEAHKAIVTRQNIKRKPYRAFKKNACEACSFIALDSCQLHVDHIDGNHLNNDINNLQTLCANCHALKSKLNGDVGRQPKLRLLERVV
jgi:5-methylcytosine-specific restriction endonuclease McrA